MLCEVQINNTVNVTAVLCKGKTSM